MRLVALAVALSALVAACGPSPEPTTPTSAETTGPASGALPVSWNDKMTKDQQIAFMKQRVMPSMKKVFQDHDANRYAEFGCKTCHGAKLGDPREFLPKLTMKDGQLTAFTEHADISKFMAEKVTPEMASAMGLKPYNPDSHEGFGCTGCHAIEKK